MLVPLVVWGFLKNLNEPHGIVELVSLYGYSMTVLIPGIIFQQTMQVVFSV